MGSTRTTSSSTTSLTSRPPVTSPVTTSRGRASGAPSCSTVRIAPVAGARGDLAVGDQRPVPVRAHREHADAQLGCRQPITWPLNAARCRVCRGRPDRQAAASSVEVGVPQDGLHLGEGEPLVSRHPDRRRTASVVHGPVRAELVVGPLENAACRPIRQRARIPAAGAPHRLAWVGQPVGDQVAAQVAEGVRGGGHGLSDPGALADRVYQLARPVDVVQPNAQQFARPGPGGDVELQECAVTVAAHLGEQLIPQMVGDRPWGLHRHLLPQSAPPEHRRRLQRRPVCKSLPTPVRGRHRIDHRTNAEPRMKGIEPADHAEVVIDRARRVPLPERWLAGLQIHRPRRRRRAVPLTEPLRVARFPQPANERRDFGLRGLVPGDLQVVE